jgi:lipid A 4'-phosphatase
MKLKIFSLRFHLAVYGILLAAGTIPFWLTNLDLRISDYWFFRESGWASIEHPFWGSIYKFGTGPNIILLYLALIVFFFSWQISKNSKTKLKALCIILAIALGPGLLVNGLLKPLMGRPRPNVMERYSGSQEYVKPLVPANGGESFPSGHSASGFGLTILFYILYRDKKKLAWTAWFGGMGLGILLSVCRIAQGGHFLSDVIWAMGVTQIVNCLLYFKMEPAIEKQKEGRTRIFASASRKAKSAYISIAFFLTLLIGLSYLINFPFTFFKTAYYKIPPSVSRIIIDAPLEKEKIKLFDRPDRQIGFDHLVFASGFPWSSVKPNPSIKIEGEELIYSIEIKQKGIFRDYRGRIKLFLPQGLKIDLSRIKGDIVEDNRK